jgi:hypothetical protein
VNDHLREALDILRIKNLGRDAGIVDETRKPECIREQTGLTLISAKCGAIGHRT